MSSGDGSIYDPFEKLVDIQIEGCSFAVPENNILLRCIQFIVDEGVVLGRFCWNNECGNCEVTLQTVEHPDPQRARGCQTLVEAGMALSELTPDLRYWLHHKLKR
jgi:predicted molibdopterin-dependent oxidoreductase YjgC